MRFLRVCEASCWRTSTSCCDENWALLSISWRSCWSFSLGIAILFVKWGLFAGLFVVDGAIQLFGIQSRSFNAIDDPPRLVYT